MTPRTPIFKTSCEYAELATNAATAPNQTKNLRRRKANMLICSFVIPSPRDRRQEEATPRLRCFVVMSDREAIGKKEASLIEKIWLAARRHPGAGGALLA